MKLSGQVHVAAALPRRKNPRYPLDRKLGGPQTRSGHCGREKNLSSLPGIEPHFLVRPARSPSLYPLSYPISLSFLLPFLASLSLSLSLSSLYSSYFLLFFFVILSFLIILFPISLSFCFRSPCLPLVFLFVFLSLSLSLSFLFIYVLLFLDCNIYDTNIVCPFPALSILGVAEPRREVIT
jgi:hypothetical protein